MLVPPDGNIARFKVARIGTVDLEPVLSFGNLPATPIEWGDVPAAGGSSAIFPEAAKKRPATPNILLTCTVLLRRLGTTRSTHR